jgi:molybdopterin molybdotransferase
MLELEDAIGRILAEIPSSDLEQIPLGTAHGRVLFDSLAAPMDLPPFDNSAMDGYAVRAQDTAGACRDNPVRLKLVGKIAAGEGPTAIVEPGCAMRIFTGSVMPAGADCVVMQEDTISRVEDPAFVSVLEQARPWENVRLRGEDVRTGSKILCGGQTLGAGALSILASLGVAEVRVGRQPAVGILATGSELQEPGQDLTRGQIYESNRVGLSALVRAAGAKPMILPIVADSLDTTARAVSEGLSRCDLLVTVGGASVGDFDLIKPAVEQIGGRLNFWKVAIKPGRPFVFGQAGTKLIFGLPGNPVSALVTFLLLVRPALRRWQGAEETALRGVRGRLAEPLNNHDSRRHFVRVKVDSDGEVRVSGPQASHMLSSFAGANGLLDVPPGTTLPQGEPVTVRIWEI